jgi:hypothetical protein
MPNRSLLPALAFLFLYSSLSVTQQSTAPHRPAAAAPVAAAAQQFPLILQQNITAGKTAVGTRVQGKLAIATLVNGTVIPRDGVFSGQVIQSTAKTKTDPSRLSIRIDLAQWKNGSAPLKLYLTKWYYPVLAENGENLQYGPEQSARRTWNGMGQYPDPNSPAYHPFPGGASTSDPAAPEAPAAVTSNHPLQMKNVEVERGTDGVSALVSKRSNLKLEKFVTYVFASPELVPATAK